MCWQCDRPSVARADYVDFMQWLMIDHGWAVQFVERDRIRPSYAYTVGLTARDSPELLVTGLSSGRAARLLNAAAEHLCHADAPRPGERFRLELPGSLLIEVVRVAEPSVHLVTATEFFGDQVRALQLVYADDRGRWPWQRVFRGSRGGQPVLGARAAWPGAAP
jgi:Domain of unknown function (DUF4262)